MTDKVIEAMTIGVREAMIAPDNMISHESERDAIKKMEDYLKEMEDRGLPAFERAVDKNSMAYIIANAEIERQFEGLP